MRGGGCVPGLWCGGAGVRVCPEGAIKLKRAEPAGKAEQRARGRLKRGARRHSRGHAHGRPA